MESNTVKSTGQCVQLAIICVKQKKKKTQGRMGKLFYVLWKDLFIFKDLFLYFLKFEIM